MELKRGEMSPLTFIIVLILGIAITFGLGLAIYVIGLKIVKKILWK